MCPVPSRAGPHSLLHDVDLVTPAVLVLDAELQPARLDGHAVARVLRDTAPSAAPARPCPPRRPARPHLVLVQAHVAEAAGAQAVAHLPGPAAAGRVPAQRGPSGGPLAGGGRGGPAPLHGSAAGSGTPPLLPRHRPAPPAPARGRRRQRRLSPGGRSRRARSRGGRLGPAPPPLAAGRRTGASPRAAAAPAEPRWPAPPCNDSAMTSSRRLTSPPRHRHVSAGAGPARTCRTAAGSGRGCGGTASPLCPAPRRSTETPAEPPARWESQNHRISWAGKHLRDQQHRSSPCELHHGSKCHIQCAP